VADLVVHPPQVDAAGFDAQIEASVFDPWQALAAHRPLGEVMRSRRVGVLREPEGAQRCLNEAAGLAARWQARRAVSCANLG